ASSRGHCCPLIDGFDQREGAEAAGKLLEWTPDAERPAIKLDLTAAYPAQANLESWTRGATCDHQSASISIVDAFKTNKAGAKIVHRIWSFEKPELQRRGGGNEGIVFKLGSLSCEVTPAPESHDFRAFDPKEFGIGSYERGVTLHRIDLTYQTG